MKMNHSFPENYKTIRLRIYNSVNGTENFRPFNRRLKSIANKKIYELQSLYFMEMEIFLMNCSGYDMITLFIQEELSNLEISNRDNPYYLSKGNYPFKPIDSENDEECLAGLINYLKAAATEPSQRAVWCAVLVKRVLGVSAQ